MNTPMRRIFTHTYTSRNPIPHNRRKTLRPKTHRHQLLHRRPTPPPPSGTPDATTRPTPNSAVACRHIPHGRVGTSASVYTTHRSGASPSGPSTDTARQTLTMKLLGYTHLRYQFAPYTKRKDKKSLKFIVCF